MKKYEKIKKDQRDRLEDIKQKIIKNQTHATLLEEQ